ncbi:hypothetical protein HanIR_Chr15g0756291 [Helianthus annuus]|nr:hypothetical protein HanIR_Chr15g0756291 [Helianthus annuus]
MHKSHEPRVFNHVKQVMMWYDHSSILLTTHTKAKHIVRNNRAFITPFGCTINRGRLRGQQVAAHNRL